MSIYRIFQIFEDRLVKRKTASVTVPPGWRVKEISLHRDELLRDIDIGDQSLFDERRMTYLDQYDVTVRIERDGWGHVIKIFYPLIIMLAVLYLICFAPPDRLSIRLLLSAVMLITIAIYHLRVLSDMPMVYTTPVEYGVFSLYVFAVMSIFLSIRIYTNYQKGCEKQSRTLVRAGKLIFPCLVFVLASLIAFMY